MPSNSDNPKDKPATLTSEQITKITTLINEMDERMAGFTLGQVLQDLTGLDSPEISLIVTEYIQRIRERGDSVANLLNHMVLIGAWCGIRHITRVMKGRPS